MLLKPLIDPRVDLLDLIPVFPSPVGYFAPGFCLRRPHKMVPFSISLNFRPTEEKEALEPHSLLHTIQFLCFVLISAILVCR